MTRGRVREVGGVGTVRGDVSVKCLMGSQVFFIRHGESRWNEAQAKRDVLQMVSHVDHPLNEHGFQQVLLGLLLLPPTPRPAPLHQPSPSSPRIRLTTSTQKPTTHLSPLISHRPPHVHSSPTFHHPTLTALHSPPTAHPSSHTSQLQPTHHLHYLQDVCHQYI